MNIVEARQKLTFWGWVVAVHNDYKLNGKHRTFWLFTCGTRCAKGEGFTDEEAIAEVLKEVEKQAAEAWAAGDRENDAARLAVIRKQLESDLQAGLKSIDAHICRAVGLFNSDNEFDAAHDALRDARRVVEKLRQR